MVMQEPNKWCVSFAIISFFKTALSGHSTVSSFTRTHDIFFTIKDKRGRILKVLLLDEYVLGLAAIYRAQSEFPELEYIVTGTNWNGYTPEAKEYGLSNSIGIFNLTEFLGALNWSDPKKYCKRDEDGNPIYPYKNP